MTDHELQYWKSGTDISKYRWVEDEITKANGKGYLFYTGGTEGYYMRLAPNGHFSIGTYEGAIPHIGEAMFTPKAEHQYDNIGQASMAALKIGGRQFLTDMFRNDAPPLSDLEDRNETNQVTVLPDEVIEDIGMTLS